MSKIEEEQEPRIFERRQVMIGVGILGVFLLLVLALMLGWRKVPGVERETLGIFAGLISTSFLLEFSFVVADLLIVVGLNSWRRHREGVNSSIWRWRGSGCSLDNSSKSVIVANCSERYP